MKTFLTQEDPSTLSGIEMSIWLFHKQREIKYLSSSEISEGISLYPEYIEFWKNHFSKDNLILFLKNEVLSEDAKNWFFENYLEIKGSLNLESMIFNSEIGELLSYINPLVLEEEIRSTVNDLKELEETLNRSIKVKMIRIQNGYELKLDNMISEKKESSNLNKCLSLLSVPLISLIVLSANLAEGQSKSKEQILNDNIKQLEIYKNIEQASKNLEKEAKDFIKKYGLELPSGVLAAGIKAGVEQKIEFKGGIDETPIDYELSVGLSESMVKFKSRADFLQQKMDTWIKGSNNYKETKIEIGLQYSF